MPNNCECKKCYKTKCANTCLLLSEPCNPCQPKVITYSVPAPYDPCNPCNPCPPLYPSLCPPLCPPPCNSDTNPQYVVNNSIMGGNGGTITLTNTQVNNTNFFVFNPTNDTLEVVLPLISTLNNQQKKSVYLVNLSVYDITLNSSNNGTNVDSLNGQATTTIGKYNTLVVHSLPGVSSGNNGSVWAVNQ